MADDPPENRLTRLSIVVALLAALWTVPAAHAADPAWVTESNHHAQLLLDPQVSPVGIADVKITKVTSDERDDDHGCRQDDGDDRGADDDHGCRRGHKGTGHDITIGSDCRSVMLSAERDDGGNGRVYTIFVHVTDVAGNRADAVVKVMVPRNPHFPIAIDDEPKLTVSSSCL